MAELGIIASIIQVAGTGFRLSLLLNGVASEIASADKDIRNVAKGISLFSMMLKQIGKTMEEGKAIASQQAIETATEIKNQSEKVFEEIRGMVEFNEAKDDYGNSRSITVVEKVKWCFRKNKVEYLLGQLESLKLSLSIMLQILQMGQTMAAARDDPSKTPLRDKALQQEKAEIYNMVLTQHWSLVELRKLYELADQEARNESQSPLLDDPPPSYDTYRTLEQGLPVEQNHVNDQQLSLHVPAVPPKVDNSSQAVVKYQEKPLHQLDASFNKALARENHVMNADVPDIVEHLLSQWTVAPERQSHPSPPRDSQRDTRPSPPRDSPRDTRRKSYYESDTDDTSDSEFEGALTGGRYLEATPRKHYKGKPQFRARVESDPEDHERERQRERGPRKHIIQSGESDTSSDSDNVLPPSRTRPHPRRRSSDASSHHSETHDRVRRPYMSGGLSNVPEDASGSRTRGVPPSPMPVPIRPMPTPNQQWPPTPQGTPSNPGFRAPSFNNGPYPGSPRIQTNGHYAPPPSANGHYPPPPTGYMPGPSPQPQAGNYFPRMQMPGPPPPPIMGMGMPQQQQRPHRQHNRRQHRHEDRESMKIARERDKAMKAEESNKNLKRGLFGGAALAGVLDLLQGLDGI